MPNVVSYMQSIQYDGTNAEYICGTWANVRNEGEDENGLVIGSAESDKQLVTVGMWLIKQSEFPNWVSAHTPEQYVARFREIA